jgi:hypothetical protein
MNKRLPFVLAVVLCGACPLLAQRPEEQHPAPQAQPPHNPAPPRANNGRIPPPPTKRENPPTKPHENKPEVKQENRPEAQHETRHENVKPHVENDQWVGYDTNDARYHVAHPYQHGHFEHFGQQYRYSVQRIDRDHHRFWFPGGFYFQVADWDWGLASDWCWNCGDDFVVYEDPDHEGWYLVYNVQTGEYVHAEYMGG